jgi:hypothetical protein
MSKRGRARASGTARPIRTKRDRENAAAVAKEMSGQANRDSAAERRLQALLQELDRVEEADFFESDDAAEEEEYLGPHRRWSDD